VAGSINITRINRAVVVESISKPANGWFTLPEGIVSVAFSRTNPAGASAGIGHFREMDKVGLPIGTLAIGGRVGGRSVADILADPLAPTSFRLDHSQSTETSSGESPPWRRKSPKSPRATPGGIRSLNTSPAMPRA